MFEVNAFKQGGQGLTKVYDSDGNELSMYIKPDGEMEMRYFSKDGGSSMVFKGDWRDGRLKLYKPSGWEDDAEIWHD